MNDRTLLYNCCDDEYTHFIPFHCAAALFSNENIDIEIGINLNKLTNDEEEAIEKLKKMHPECKILIKYNFYKKTSRRLAIYNGLKMWSNSVRFVSEPEIKNTYTYISDIDMMILMKNFYNYHINIMNQYGTIYSNWNRDVDRRCITGLHFCKTAEWYPIDISGLRLDINDEHLLMQIAQKKTSINTQIPRRPTCGLHFSHGQNLKTQLTLTKKYVDELNSYKRTFFDFLESKEYACIKATNTTFINNYIDEFKRYYNTI